MTSPRTQKHEDAIQKLKINIAKRETTAQPSLLLSGAELKELSPVRKSERSSAQQAHQQKRNIKKKKFLWGKAWCGGSRTRREINNEEEYTCLGDPEPD